MLDVIIGKAEELINLFVSKRLRPLTNSCYFLRISTVTLHRYSVPKIIYEAQAKGTLRSLGTDIVLLQLLQNPITVFLIFGWGFTNNKDIIKVDHAVDIKTFL